MAPFYKLPRGHLQIFVGIIFMLKHDLLPKLLQSWPRYLQYVNFKRGATEQ